MLKLAFSSLMSRKRIILLIYLSLSLSVLLFLGVQRTARISRESFSRTITGTDLIVGARTGPLNLILYSVFHLGNPVNNISYGSYRRIASRDDVDWVIPISLGDSHRGYRVVGTDNTMFRRYRYGSGRSLEFADGGEFTESPFDVVLGATIARKLGYELGDRIVVSHGAGKVALKEHTNLPFTVAGILKRSGTPVDNSLFVSVEGITAIHLGWEDGVERREVTVREALNRDLTPASITAAYVGLKNRGAALNVQRAINDFEAEPLTAVLPGVALYELWKIMGTAERSLTFLAGFVVVIGLVSLLTAQLAVLEQRRREMALLRSLGAKARDLFRLLFVESFAVTFAGCVSGFILLYVVQALASGLMRSYGFHTDWSAPNAAEGILLGSVLVLGILNGLIPAIVTYRRSLSDGMAVRK